VGGYLSHFGINRVISQQSVSSATFVKLSLALFAVYAVLRMLRTLVNYALQTSGPYTYIPFQFDFKDKEVVVVDTTHATSPTLTHHKGANNPRGLQPSDTSTGLVLNAIQATYLFGGDAYSLCQIPCVSTNHFDIDSFLAVWCYINRKVALQYEAGKEPTQRMPQHVCMHTMKDIHTYVLAALCILHCLYEPCQALA
jgi:hypothetical protein